MGFGLLPNVLELVAWSSVFHWFDPILFQEVLAA